MYGLWNGIYHAFNFTVGSLTMLMYMWWSYNMNSELWLSRLSYIQNKFFPSFAYHLIRVNTGTTHFLMPSYLLVIFKSLILITDYQSRNLWKWRKSTLTFTSMNEYSSFLSAFYMYRHLSFIWWIILNLWNSVAHTQPISIEDYLVKWGYKKSCTIQR